MDGSEFVSFLEEKRAPFVFFLPISILFLLGRPIINDSVEA
uniref:Alternative protein C19orf57 n=1 Tax=Homo sapiens TaxID=9606 RepID=L8EC49_HUMAN|nr:alternative protein C19orf57 [Homo sapiens]